ncbi:MAG: sigma-70 factor domain-containing protein, partial [Planctomycetota bacterium]
MTMLLMDQQLADLVQRGFDQGCLTYHQVNAYLPDEDASPKKLNRLIEAIERFGIQLIDDESLPEATRRRITPDLRSVPADNAPHLSDEDDDHDTTVTEPETLASSDLPKASDDPIRMYLSQMAEIPLLTREQEISLAKKIEVTRRQFRRCLLESDYALRHTVEVLRRVHEGELPFDRTI